MNSDYREQPGNDKPSATVVHLLPIDIARGAQAYARTLADHLSRPQERHLIVTIFKSGEGVASPDIELNARAGFGRKAGFEPGALLRLRRLLRSLHPAVVVAHGGESAKYAAAAIDSGQPMVYVMIGSLHHRLTNPIRRIAHRRYVHRANIVVAVSEVLAKEAVETHGVPANRVVVIPNGRDASRFRPRGHEGDRGSVKVVFVGQLDQWKRPELFLDIVEEVRRRGHDVTAQVVGDGPLADRVGKRSGEGIEILGSRTDVEDILGTADVMLFTGRPPEGMPGVLIEAGLSGLPVVTTDVPGAAEVVAHGETGFVVDVEDLGELADRLEELVADADMRAEMGSAARDRCTRLYSMAATEESWRRVLSEVVTR